MIVNAIMFSNNSGGVDTSEDTVTPSTLSYGITAHDSNGSPITGIAETFTFNTNGTFRYPPKVIIPNTVTGTTSSNSGLKEHSEIEEIFFENGSPSSFRYLVPTCFSGCNGLKKITMPDSIIGLQGSTFNNCNALEDVIFNDNQKITISTNEFYNCYNLKQQAFESILAHLSSSQTQLTNNLFNGCRAITSVKIPSQITTLGSSVFSACSALETVELSAVTTVNRMVFSGCVSLKTVKFDVIASGLGINESGANNMFYNCTSLEDIQIPVDWTTNMFLSNGSATYTNMLTHDSMIAMLENLYDYSDGTTHTLTLGTTNLERLSAEEIAIGTNKNWTIT